MLGASSGHGTLPPDLLHVAAGRDGRIALVLGAGCSLEQPTSLKLARTYSTEVHEQLVRDGVLEMGDCPSPEDLSVLASTVVAKVGVQAPVVERLPRQLFRMAYPNTGYLDAAALLREGVLTCVLTLNFDLAMTTALTELSATDVNVVPGPAATAELGATSVVYLHRNVDELDMERWILRVDALEEEWRGAWEEVISSRVMSTPVVVFAGLGSPAAVLTEAIKKVRGALDPAVHKAYVVSPSTSTDFEAALDLPEDAHVQMGWCAFMRALARRVSEELVGGLASSCRGLRDAHGWDDDDAMIDDLCARLGDLGLVDAGMLKARWLLSEERYVADDARREHVADLLLALGKLAAVVGAPPTFQADGVVRMSPPGKHAIRLLVASGRGTLRWTALEPRLRTALAAIAEQDRPRGVVVGGVAGSTPQDVAPPPDVISEDSGADIVSGPGLIYFTVDDVRENPSVVAEKVA